MKAIFGFLLVALLLGFGSTAFAIQLNAPSSLAITESRGMLEAKVFNDSSVEQPLRVDFFAPTRVSIQAPQTVPANSEATIQIRIFNYSYVYDTVYASELRASLGSDTATQKISLSFVQPTGELQPAPSSNPGGSLGQSFSNALTGIVTAVNLGPLLKAGSAFWHSIYSELALQIILIVIIVVLAVALIARVYNRTKERKK